MDDWVDLTAEAFYTLTEADANNISEILSVTLVAKELLPRILKVTFSNSPRITVVLPSKRSKTV